MYNTIQRLKFMRSRILRPGIYRRNCLVSGLLGCLMLAALTLSSCGYHFDDGGQRKLLPCPLLDLPYEVTGSVQHVWVGNEFQMAVDDRAHYIVLQGVNNPDSHKHLEDMAYDKLKSLLSDLVIHVSVEQRDGLERAVGRVYVGDLDVNLEMILTGCGRYDGSVFEGSEAFAAAEDLAKRQNLGIWKELDE